MVDYFMTDSIKKTDETKKTKMLDKIDIIQSLLESYPELNHVKASKVVNTIFEQITTALMCGDRIELRGFCSMIIRKRKDMVIRNPKTQKEMKVNTRGIVYFRASKELIKLLNSTNDMNS